MDWPKLEGSGGLGGGAPGGWLKAAAKPASAVAPAAPGLAPPSPGGAAAGALGPADANGAPNYPPTPRALTLPLPLPPNPSLTPDP